MATPATSGSLALIRQYYTEGWYPTGTKTTADAFTPTGALMKATVVNSAVKMSTFTWVNGTTILLGEPPGMHIGVFLWVRASIVNRSSIHSDGHILWVL